MPRKSTPRSSPPSRPPVRVTDALSGGRRTKQSHADAVASGRALDRDTLSMFTNALSGVLTTDAFANAPARLGYASTNLSEGAAYPLTRLSRNYILMQSLYRSNWIARKVVDAMAEDMVKKWVDIKTDFDNEQIDRFTKSVNLTGTRDKILEAIKWARLFGGSGAVMIIAGHENRLQEPLDLDEVEPDSYRGLLVFDRWSGISPSAGIATDINDPLSFGLPKSYQVTTETAKTFNIHASRVLRFTGRTLPSWERQAEMYWGISEIEVMFDELKKRDNTSWNIASLIFRANILALKQKDLSQILSGVGKNATAQQQFYSQLQAMTQLMSNQGLIVLPEEGGLEQRSYSFGGVADVYVNFMLDICGATEYTMSRLFGRTASGLGQGNEGDEHMYYDLVGTKQQRELDPQLKKLFPVVAMSTWGEIPDDFEWSYPAVRTLSAEEAANVGALKSKAILDPFVAGVTGRKTTLKELQALGPETGMFTNIDDETIEDADDEVLSPLDEMEQQQEIELEGAGQQDKLAQRQHKRDLEDADVEMKSGRHKDKLDEKKLGRDQERAKLKAAADKKSGGKKGKSKKKTKDSADDPDPDLIPTDLIDRNDMTQDLVRAYRHQQDSADPHPLQGRIKFQGLDISVEHLRNSTRQGTSESDSVAPGIDGERRWSIRLTHPYGYIRRTEGVDGDHLDCFIGPNPNAAYAYVIHAKNPGTGKYDEDKVMLGWDSAKAAHDAFLENYDDPKFFESMEKVPMAKFKELIAGPQYGEKVTLQ